MAGFKNVNIRYIGGVVIAVAGMMVIFGSCSKRETSASQKAPVTITFGIQTAWDNIMPYNSSSNSGYAHEIYDILWEKLAYIEQGGLSFRPRAADRWENADNGKSIIFYLNKNATWHDGKPITAADWVFTAQLISNPELKVANRPFWGLEGTDNGGIELSPKSIKAEALDDYTLKFTFKTILFPEDFLVLQGRFIYVLPKHLLENIPPAKLLDNEFWEHPIAAGPGKLVSEIVGNEIVFAANKEFYLGTPQWDNLVISVVDPSVMLSAMIAGEMDYCRINEFSAQSEIIAQQAGFETVHSSVYTNFLEVVLNNTSISDPRVRQAMHYALDKQALTDLGVPGIGQVAHTYIMPGSEYRNDDITISRDLDKARRLLDAANYDYNKTWIFAIGPARESLAAAIQQQLAEAGIKVELQVVDVATMFAGLTNGKYDMGITAHGALAYPLYINDYFSSTRPTWFSIKDTTYDEYREKISNTIDKPERIRLTKELQAYIFETTPMIPVWYATTIYPVSKTVKNMDYTSFSGRNYWEWVKE
ncbi:MAG: peptide ABC transporter substrate-binding protein [Treponema sp.]|nr:peptide ABC transporter substrate-binding protein [Treponema sp.]